MQRKRLERSEKSYAKSLIDTVRHNINLCKLEEQLERMEGETSVQKTIPYEEIFENGICHVRDDFYTKTMEFFDINYKLAPEDTQRHIFDAYCHFLNYFDEKITVQFSYINARTDQREIDEVINIPDRDDDYKIWIYGITIGLFAIIFAMHKMTIKKIEGDDKVSIEE